MIEKGKLYIANTDHRDTAHWDQVLVEIARTYDKRDIDPDCPESVAIVPMVEAIVLTGENIGRTRRFRRRYFSRNFKPVEVAE